MPKHFGVEWQVHTKLVYFSVRLSECRTQQHRLSNRLCCSLFRKHNLNNQWEITPKHKRLWVEGRTFFFFLESGAEQTLLLLSKAMLISYTNLRETWHTVQPTGGGSAPSNAEMHLQRQWRRRLLASKHGRKQCFMMKEMHSTRLSGYTGWVLVSITDCKQKLC